MFAEFGYGILVVSFLVAIYSVIAAIYGAKNKSAALVESARRAMLLMFPLHLAFSGGIDLFTGQQSF